jgi:putative MFS transporter
VPVVGFLANSLAQHTWLGIPGWRWMFVIGAVGAGCVFLLRRGLPESPRWLASAGRNAEADAIVTRFEDEATATVGALPEPTRGGSAEDTGQFRSLFGPRLGRRTSMMVVFHILQTFGYYGFGTLVPLVLTAKGFPISKSLLFTALTFLGYPIGSALSLLVVERIERKFLVIGGVLAMAVLGVAFGYSDTTALILTFGFLYTAVSNVFSNAYHIYQAEIFPTRLRSTASSGTYSLSRLTTAAMPFVLVPLLHGAGPNALFAVVAAAMVVVAIDVAVLGPRTTGRALESVNESL